MGMFARRLDQEHPPILLSAGAAQTMLEQWRPGCAIERLERFSGGLRNTAYKVELAGQREPLVLRVCPGDGALLRRECALLAHIHQLLPVPAPLFADASASQPYAIMRYIPGQTLDDIWEQLSADDLREIFAAVGAVLARIHAIQFPAAGPFDDRLRPTLAGDSYGRVYLDQIYALLRPLAAQRDPALAFVPRLVRALEDNAARLVELSPQNRLVHSDFNPKNILVGRHAGSWGVTGIIDWEFSFSGSPLVDIGNLLRFEDELPAHARARFIAGYTQAGGSLPAGWRTTSMLLDLAVMADFLVRRAEKPRSFQTAAGICTKTLERLQEHTHAWPDR